MPCRACKCNEIILHSSPQIRHGKKSSDILIWHQSDEQSSSHFHQELQMSTQYMWGDKQQYGPFSAGEDGYPCCGEVVRHYRVLKGYNATKFGELYGQALGQEAKTRIWVLTMERTNNVPVVIARRRVIADLLGIPYVLLGIAPTLAKTPLATTDMPAPETAEEAPRVPKRETLIAAILTEHEQALASYNRGFFHRHGQAALTEVMGATEQVSIWLPNTRQHVQRRGLTLISGYHQFGTAIGREQQQYGLAINHGDSAIEYAEAAHKIKPDSDLMAITFCRRATPSFEREITRVNQDSNYREAVSHIDTALSYARSATPLMSDFISLQWGLIHAFVATSEKDRTKVRKHLAQAYNSVSAYQEGDDTHPLKYYNYSWYHLTYAEALIGLRDYAGALGELDVAEEMTPLNLPRRFAYIDTLRAMAYIGLGEFKEAVGYAKSALIESKAVKSEYNIARIAKVYRQLRERYKHSSDVTELGRELAKTHPHLV
jgi:tetratricopeptide (TPR) repeat protein